MGNINLCFGNSLLNEQTLKKFKSDGYSNNYVPQLVSFVPPPLVHHLVAVPPRPAAPALPAAAVAEREGSGVPRSSR